MTQDPVCGKSVDEKTAPASSSFEGRNYSFCSRECKQKFDRNPEQYPSLAQQAKPQTRKASS